MATVTADELYAFILANAEEVDGQVVCRAFLAPELRRRGVPKPVRQHLRIRLVKELEARGLVKRVHPQSRTLILLAPAHVASSRGKRRTASVDYTNNKTATRRRIRELETYMTANVLAGKRFVCPSAMECATSILPGCSFQEAHLSHIGNHYDMVVGGREMRVIVVGQEVGKSDRSRVSIAERSQRVRTSGLTKHFYAEPGHPPRNRHMRGTTLALRTIFGTGPGTDREDEFLELPDGPTHLFDCFALVNRLLCSAHVTGTSNGKSTTTMLNNCQRHFAATLEILQPTIVVIQGVRMWKWSKNVLVPDKRITDHLVKARLAGNEVMVATLTHPSARSPHRWDSPDATYFKDVVYPTLRQAVPL